MKWAILLTVTLLNYITLVAQSTGRYKFTLTGAINGMDSGYVFLNYIPNGEMGILDSSIVHHGYFELKGYVTEPTKAWFSTFGRNGVHDESNLTQFYIEPGDLKLCATINHLKSLELLRSASDNDRKRLELLEEPVNAEIYPAEDIYSKYHNEYRIEKSNNTDTIRLKGVKQKEDSIGTLLDRLYRKKAQIDSLFIIRNPNSYVAADMLSGSNVSWIAFPSLDSLYSKFPVYIQQSFPGKKIKWEIDREKAMPIGGDAKVFITKDSKGDTIRLVDYKTKKYVLLDFGASWCGPCRQIIPLLKKYYTTYKTELEIISIAQQDEVNDWRKAIKDDNMEWPQVIENKNLQPIEPANGSISDMYYVSTIPSLILIDKDLKLIGKYGGFYYSRTAYMVDLEKKLSELIRMDQ
jgi:thiol-disulfide isomerase/thioredoxin